MTNTTILVIGITTLIIKIIILMTNMTIPKPNIFEKYSFSIINLKIV
jgi:hypothetical protein